jgi:ubiquinone/menaquinone biosynthesis C-methylase UbiE
MALSFHALSESRSVLELGCGVGANLSCLANSHSGPIVGLDISENSVLIGNGLTGENDTKVIRLIHDFKTLNIFSPKMFAITFTDASMYTLGRRSFSDILREADRVTGDFLVFLELQVSNTEKQKFTRDGFLRNYGYECKKIGMQTLTFPLPPHLRTGGRWPQIGAITIATRNKSSSELASILASFT